MYKPRSPAEVGSKAPILAVDTSIPRHYYILGKDQCFREVAQASG